MWRVVDASSDPELQAELRAERAKSAELLAALAQLVADIGGTSHCQDCDEADWCACGLTLVQAHAAAARALIARATGGEP